jgi:nitronate monooxygenase
MGTRFIATRESRAPQAYKEMLVASSTSDVIYTPVFTHGVPCNFLKTSIRANGFDPDKLSADTTPQDPLFATRKPWRDIWAAGHSVGLIDDIPTVAELVERLQREYADARAKLIIR